MKSWKILLLSLLFVVLITGCKSKTPNDICPPPYLVAPLFVAPPNLAHVDTELYPEK